jgi:hypothetical protein
VKIGAIHVIGKESDLLEEVESGQVHDVQEAYTEYRDARRDRKEWRSVVAWLRTKTKSQPRSLSAQTGLSLTMLRAARAGCMPHRENRKVLARAVTNQIRRGK